jgi:hypothetical protein
MQTTLSTNVERIRAALRALRQTHDHDPHRGNKTALGAKCLKVVIAQLAEDGVATEDLQPLIDLAAELKPGRPQAARPPNRRRGGAPTEALLARISAVIDLLVKAGYDEGEAAQIVTRRLLAAGEGRRCKRLEAHIGVAGRFEPRGGIGRGEVGV